jgi:hypothetical protein
MNRRRVFALLCAAVFVLGVSVFAQEADNVTPATAATTGKFVFTFTVTVSSTVPKNGIVVCTAMASLTESSSGQSISQKAIGIATPSGGKATCTANMPYSWALASASSDHVTLSYKVELDYADQVTASNGTGTLVEVIPADAVNENLSIISVPISGATTDEAVSATI